MKALELLKEYANIDFRCTMGTHQEECLEAIAELEALLKSRSCDGCKYQTHFISDIQPHGNWIKYSVFYDCINDKPCRRNIADRFELRGSK